MALRFVNNDYTYRYYDFLQQGKKVGEVWLCPDRNGVALSVWSVQIKKEERRKGFGTEMMQDVISWAKLNRFKRLELLVNESNLPAINLYKKVGFQISSPKQFGKISENHKDVEAVMMFLEVPAE